MEAKYYEKITPPSVQCFLCFRKCVIPNMGLGFCKVRENREGKLYTLTYGKPCGVQIDPIELEPMYHMVPGHKNLCVYTPGCNFNCKHCQNWHISQRGSKQLETIKLTPEEVVSTALKLGCKSISFSINEPTVFYEYMLDIAKLAQKTNLFTLFHSNGTLSPAPLTELLKFMDGVVIDLKSFSNEFYQKISSAQLAPVLTTLKIIKNSKVHLEVVYLIIPTLNDNLEEIRRCCKWIVKELGRDVPLHFTRFFPHYKLKNLPPTPITTLEEAYKIAKKEGLNYVYIGNVPGHKANNTYCIECEQVIVRRKGYKVMDVKIEKGRCKFCGERIVGIFDEK